MAAAIQDFPQWLNSKLQQLNADETVFGSYIQGILDSDETSEEKNEALQGILSEFVESVSYPISTLINLNLCFIFCFRKTKLSLFARI